MNKKYLVSGALVSMLLFSQVDVNASSNFSDIPQSHAASTQIEYLVNDGVISGFPDGTFRPDQVVTRGQFAAFIARALDLTSSSVTFKDVTKGNSLYKEINQAATAGIIMGYKDGNFKPDQTVSRSDMAVMLDRAMQLKGSYTKTISLSYSDAGSIGAYAIESIKRMTAYGVMEALQSNNFKPGANGTRLGTVMSIYNMLQTIDTKKPIEVPADKKDSDMTMAELTQKYGEQKVIGRTRSNNNFYETNLLEHYHLYYKDLYKDFIDYKNMLKQSFVQQYNAYYPYEELISYNGKAYKSSELYKGDLDFVNDDLLPTNPQLDSQFSIDIFLNSKDSATYLKNDVLTKTMTNEPYEKNGDIMVDLEVLLKDHINVSSSTTKLIIKNEKTIEFTSGSNEVKVNSQTVYLESAVERSNGKLMIPLREAASIIGLYTRTYTGLDSKFPTKLTRIELANFPLSADYKR